MSKALSITITVPAEATDQEMQEAVNRIATAASEYHSASGGSGLVVKSVRVIESAEPVGWFEHKWLVLKAVLGLHRKRLRSP